MICSPVLSFNPSCDVVRSHASAIPTGRLQPSMNLSHAATVILSEIFARRCGALTPAPLASAATSVAAAAAGEAEATLGEASSGGAGGSEAGTELTAEGGADGAAAESGGARRGLSEPVSQQELELLMRRVRAGGCEGGAGGRRLSRCLPIFLFSSFFLSFCLCLRHERHRELRRGPLRPVWASGCGRCMARSAPCAPLAVKALGCDGGAWVVALRAGVRHSGGGWALRRRGHTRK
jgi:hypothetical protein